MTIPYAYPHLAKAMKKFLSETEPKLQQWWNEADTDQKVKGAQALEEEARQTLCRAFHQDTSDYNSLNNCLLLSIDRLRQIAKDLRS